MQEDNTRNTRVDKSTRDSEYREAEKTNKKTFLYLTLAVLAVIVIVLIFMMRGESHYEKGNMYLKDKKYSEALSEYQKVDAGDKDFRMAQSKINYINGLNAYNAAMYPAAEMYLVKVATDDEYYQASQLMLKQISDMRQEDNLRTQIDSLKNTRKDTVIIKHETTTNQGGNNNGNNNQTGNVSATELNKRYFVKLDKIINSFESQYQAAATAQVTSKKDYVSKMEGLRRDLINSVNESPEKDAELSQLKNDINTWIDKRIAYINKLISENSVGETNTSRSIKEEGDKLYFRVSSLQKKVRGKY